MNEHVCDPSNPDCAAYLHYADPANRQPAEDAQIYVPPRRPRRLTSHVPIRFRPEVIEQAKAIAEDEGLTVSSWIRRLVDREVTRHAQRSDSYIGTTTTTSTIPGAKVTYKQVDR
jgi:hypothetical protein